MYLSTVPRSFSFSSNSIVFLLPEIKVREHTIIDSSICVQMYNKHSIIEVLFLYSLGHWVSHQVN